MPQRLERNAKFPDSDGTRSGLQIESKEAEPQEHKRKSEFTKTQKQLVKDLASKAQKPCDFLKTGADIMDASTAHIKRSARF